MRSEYDSRDSSDSYDSYDSYDSRDPQPVAARQTAALGWISLVSTVLAFLTLFACYGCVAGVEVMRGGASQGVALIAFPLLLVVFLVCGLGSVVTALIALVVGVIGQFHGRGRIVAAASLGLMLVWGGGVWWVVSWILSWK